MLNSPFSRASTTPSASRVISSSSAYILCPADAANPSVNMHNLQWLPLKPEQIYLFSIIINEKLSHKNWALLFSLFSLSLSLPRCLVRSYRRGKAGWQHRLLECGRQAYPGDVPHTCEQTQCMCVRVCSRQPLGCAHTTSNLISRQ